MKPVIGRMPSLLSGALLAVSLSACGGSDAGGGSATGPTGLTSSISGLYGADLSVSDFAWSPDGARVAFKVSSPHDLFDRLVIFSSSAGTGVNVSTTEDVQSFAWSPDGLRLAYIARQNIPGLHFGLYTVRADGTIPITLYEGPGIGFDWSPDGAQVLVRQNDYVLGVTPRDGGAMGEPLADMKVLSSRWTADGARLLCVARPAASGPPSNRLYSVRPDGSERVELSENPEGTWIGGVQGSPDGSRVSYVVYPERKDLMAARVTGGGSTKINGTPLGNTYVLSARWSPDSAWIAYQADEAAGGGAESYIVRPDGSDRKLGGGIWSPDGSRIAYLSSGGLQIANSDGSGAARTLSPAGWAVTAFRWSPDGEWIAYTVGTGQDRVLYSTRVDGVGTWQIASGDFDEYRWAPDSAWLAWTIQPPQVGSLRSLATARFDGSQGMVRLIQTASGFTGSFSFEWSPLSSRLAYVIATVTMQPKPEGGCTHEVRSSAFVEGGDGSGQMELGF